MPLQNCHLFYFKGQKLNKNYWVCSGGEAVCVRDPYICSPFVLVLELTEMKAGVSTETAVLSCKSSEEREKSQ